MKRLIVAAFLAAVPAASYAAPKTDWYLLNPNKAQCERAALLPSYMRTPEAARNGLAQVRHAAPGVEIMRNPDTQDIEIVTIKDPNNGGELTYVASKETCEKSLKMLEDTNVIAKPGELD